MAMPNLFDDETRRLLGELHGTRHKAMPTREEYSQQLHRWLDLADKHHTPAEIAAIEADQAKRIGVMK